MKKYFFFFITFALNLNFAQDLQTTEVIRSTFDEATQSWSESTKTVTFVGLNGDLITEEKFERVNDQWIPTTKSTSYYAEGDLTEKQELTFVNGVWMNTTEFELFKNVQNKKEKEVWRKWNGTSFVDSLQALYTYTNDKVSKKIHQKRSSDDWVNTIKEDISYNTNEAESERVVSIWNGEWNICSRTRSTYYETGNLHEEFVDVIVSEVWEQFQMTKRSYTYDNKQATRDLANWDSGTGKWHPVTRDTTSFDDKRRKLKTLYQNYSSSVSPASLRKTTGWIPVWKDEYSYKDATDIKDNVELIADFSLSQNYPNPFNPSTVIRYQIPELSNVSLKVYDILGREVVTLVNEQKATGNYEVKFDGSKLASGVYIYQLNAGNFTQTKKLSLMK